MSVYRWILWTVFLLCLLRVPPAAAQAPGAWPMFGQNPQHTHRSPFAGIRATRERFAWSISGIDIGPLGGYFTLGDSTLYTLSTIGISVFAINTRTGALRWAYKPGIGVTAYATPTIGTNGQLYVSDEDGYIHAINRADGAFLWKVRLDRFSYYADEATITVGADGTLYVFGGEALHAVSPDGTVRWTYRPDFIFNPGDAQVLPLAPAVAPDATIYIGMNQVWGTQSGGILALGSDGALKWKYTTGDEPILAPAIGSDGTIYTATADRFLALKPDGTLKFDFRPLGSYDLASPAIGSDGTLHLIEGASLTARNPATGELKWSRFLSDLTHIIVGHNNRIFAAITLDAAGTIYVGTRDRLLAINPDGTDAWNLQGSFTFFEAPVIGQNGALYIPTAFDLRAYRPPPPPAFTYNTDAYLLLPDTETGAAADTTVILANTGEDTLRVRRVITDNPDLSVRPDAFVIPPGGTLADTLRFAPTRGGLIEEPIVFLGNAPSSPDTLRVIALGYSRTLAIPADTSAVRFFARDFTEASIRFLSGTVRGRSLTFDSFRGRPPDQVMVVPPFTQPLLYMDISSTIPDTVSFTASVVIQYTDTRLQSSGIGDPQQITAAWFDTTTATWNPVSTVMDPAARTARFTTSHFSPWALALLGPSGIEDPRASSRRPAAPALYQNVPNPFNPETRIRFDLPARARVTLRLYNLLGQGVATLLEEAELPAGHHLIRWNGRNGRGDAVASGVYLYRLTTDAGVRQTRRMTLLR